jgi:hypothetical protein
MSFGTKCRKWAMGSLAGLTSLLTGGVCQSTAAQTKKPNIVVIMTDDVGIWNISAQGIKSSQASSK